MRGSVGRAARPRCRRSGDVGQGVAVRVVLLTAMAAACEAFVAPAAWGAGGRWAGPAVFRGLGAGSGLLGAVGGGGAAPRARGGAVAQGITASGQGARWERPPNKGKRDVVIGTRVNTATPSPAVQHDEGFELSKYMQLPPEQYALIPLPNKAKLERISGRNFRLNVPELQFLNVWVKPVLEATIDVKQEGVDIRIVACRLEGSPEIERMGINEVFEFDISVFLSCKEDPRGLRGALIGTSLINVWVDPPSIFRAMFPKPLMEQTGNAVIGTTLNIMQNAFMKGLAEDYGRWATDAEYRAQRASAHPEAVGRIS